MKIHNVRLNFANNSSSTHSIIILSGYGMKDDTGIDSEFGWRKWVASSQTSKMDYLALQLYENLVETLPEDYARIVTRELVTTDIFDKENLDADGKTNAYIDHQSVIRLPTNYTDTAVNLQFFNEFKYFLMRPDVLILGGSDNDLEENPLTGKGINVGLPLLEEHNDLVTRKDQEQGFWAIFNRLTGAKVRLSFDEHTPTPDRSTLPELVDLHITDYCDIGCNYCYMDSKKSGKHANFLAIKDILDRLSSMGVFEIALGGGEAIDHPQFVDILHYIKENGMVPNFTTRKTEWLRDHKSYAPIFDAIGSFALTVRHSDDVEDLYVALTYNNLPKYKVSVQYVVDADPYNTYLKSILESANFYGLNVTLLGFKESGRGFSHKGRFSTWQKVELSKRKPIDIIVALKNASMLPTLGVDTALLAQYPELCDLTSDVLYTKEEGKFSCYIDAVNLSTGPSSFCTADEMTPIKAKFDVAEFVKTYSTY